MFLSPNENRARQARAVVAGFDLNKVALAWLRWKTKSIRSPSLCHLIDPPKRARRANQFRFPALEGRSFSSRVTIRARVIRRRVEELPPVETLETTECSLRREPVRDPGKEECRA